MFSHASIECNWQTDVNINHFGSVNGLVYRGRNNIATLHRLLNTFTTVATAIH